MRPDGTRVRDLTTIMQALPYVMPKRYDAQNWAEENLDEDAIRDYIRAKRREGRTVTHMSLLVSAYYRAVLKNPEILILDDSASALDYATDAKLRAAIRTLEDKTTTFIVSQRASTIRHADKIIVLDDGEIAGMGTHDELLKDCTVYQEIYYSQYPEQRGGVR